MTTMSAILTAMMLAVIVEAMVEYGSTVFAMVQQKAYKKATKQLCAIAMGIAFCVSAKVDFFGEIGMEFHAPIVGILLTGIFISRGANYVSDFMKKLQGMSGGAPTFFNPYSLDEYAAPVDADDSTEVF